MNINDYRDTISDIKATSSLKRRIVTTAAGEESKRIRFSRQVITALAVCFIVAIMIPALVLTVILPTVSYHNRRGSKRIIIGRKILFLRYKYTDRR
jgi:hypothetical protein